jgi:hypothetical protein
MTRLVLTLAFCLPLALLGRPALADQCAWISAEQADRALKLLKQGTPYLLYCEPCGEKQPTHVGTVQTAEARVAGDAGQYKEVLVDGKEVDLAYTFVKVKTADKEYQNLAKLAGCGCTGVSKSVTYPVVSARGKLAPWYGRYTRGDTTIRLKETTLHPLWVEAGISVVSDRSGDQRGELSGYLHTDETPVRFIMPFGACDLVFSLTKGSLEVKDNGKCGGLMRGVVGVYTRASAVR